MMDEIKRLAGKIEELRQCSPFNAKEVADGAMSELMRVLTELDNRLKEIERKNDTLQN